MGLMLLPFQRLRHSFFFSLSLVPVRQQSLFNWDENETIMLCHLPVPLEENEPTNRKQTRKVLRENIIVMESYFSGETPCFAR